MMERKKEASLHPPLMPLRRRSSADNIMWEEEESLAERNPRLMTRQCQSFSVKRPLRSSEKSTRVQYNATASRCSAAGLRSSINLVREDEVEEEPLVNVIEDLRNGEGIEEAVKPKMPKGMSRHSSVPATMHEAAKKKRKQRSIDEEDYEPPRKLTKCQSMYDETEKKSTKLSTRSSRRADNPMKNWEAPERQGGSKSFSFSTRHLDTGASVFAEFKYLETKLSAGPTASKARSRMSVRGKKVQGSSQKLSQQQPFILSFHVQGTQEYDRDLFMRLLKGDSNQETISSAVQTPTIPRNSTRVRSRCQKFSASEKSALPPIRPQRSQEYDRDFFKRVLKGDANQEARNAAIRTSITPKDSTSGRNRCPKFSFSNIQKSALPPNLPKRTTDVFMNEYR